jgi:hypothetical protein
VKSILEIMTDLSFFCTQLPRQRLGVRLSSAAFSLADAHASFNKILTEQTTNPDP